MFNFKSPPPCKGCTKRYVGCHSKCTGEGSYQEWKERHDKSKDEYIKQRQIQKGLDEYEIKRSRRLKRNTHSNH